MFTTIVSFIVVLGILVFFHELGHYLIARRNGIVVEEFGLGYPPRLVKLFTYKGTDFTLNLLPFGGFARMRGEDAGDMAPGSFNAATRGGRAATLLAGPIMNALLAVVLFTASFMVGFPAMAGYPQLGAVGAGSPAAEAGLEAGDILLQVSGRPAHVSAIPGIDYRVMERGEDAPAAEPMVLISRAGELLELPLAAAAGAADLLRGTPTTVVMTTVVNATAPGSPAETAGILSGDLIFAVDGTVVTADLPLNEIIAQKLGQPVVLTLLRGEEWVEITATPRVEPPPGQGALGVQIGPITTLATLPFLRSLWEGVRSTGEYIRIVLELPIMLILGQMAPADAQLSGPVGIAQLVGGAVEATIDTGLWFPILRLSAVLSAALAITNLLPLPALDGGRLLFILIETVRGRRINPEREGLVHMVGFMLLLGLLVVITVQDLRSAREGIDWLTLLGQ